MQTEEIESAVQTDSRFQKGRLMKIAVISDSHRVKRYMDNAIEIIQEEGTDLILHAGDNFCDSIYLKEKTGIPVIAVAGNCDFDNVETELDFECEGLTIFLTHGHHYGVKYGLHTLAEEAAGVGANIAIFGHTHVKENEIVDGVQIINPGSLAMPRDGRDRSFVMMELNNGSYTFEYRFI